MLPILLFEILGQNNELAHLTSRKRWLMRTSNAGSMYGAECLFSSSPKISIFSRFIGFSWCVFLFLFLL